MSERDDRVLTYAKTKMSEEGHEQFNKRRIFVGALSANNRSGLDFARGQSQEREGKAKLSARVRLKDEARAGRGKKPKQNQNQGEGGGVELGFLVL